MNGHGHAQRFVSLETHIAGESVERSGCEVYRRGERAGFFDGQAWIAHERLKDGAFGRP